MKKIIKILLLLQFILLSNIECANCQNSKNEFKADDVIKITITCEDLDIETPIRINCENFHSYFKNSFRTKTIQDYKIIKKLLGYINEADNSDNNKDFKVDVRYKIKVLYKDGMIKEICGNEAVNEIDGKVHLVNHNFSNYLKILLKQKV